MDAGTIWTVISAICLPLAAGAFGFFWREIGSVKADVNKSIARVWEEIDKIKDANTEHRVVVAQQYVVKSDLSELRTAMNDGFREIKELIAALRTRGS